MSLLHTQHAEQLGLKMLTSVAAAITQCMASPPLHNLGKWHMCPAVPMHRRCMSATRSERGGVDAQLSSHDLPASACRAIGELGPTPEALRQYEAARQPANAEVHASSVGLFKQFVAGSKDRPSELAVNIERGFVQRRFQPLVAAA